MKPIFLASLLLFAGLPVFASEPNQARVFLNEIRTMAGIHGVYKLDSRLSSAASKHCQYWADNFDELKQYAISLHDQVPGIGAYLGNMRARVAHEGYVATVGENVSNGDSDYRESVLSLLASPGHRFNFLSPGLNDLGFSSCSIDSEKDAHDGLMFVYLMGDNHNRAFWKILNQQCQTSQIKYCPAGASDCSTYRCDDGGMVMARPVNQATDRAVPVQSSGIIQYPYHGSTGVPPVSFEVAEYDPTGKGVLGTMLSVEFLPDTLAALQREPTMLLVDKEGVEQPLVPVSASALPDGRPGLRAWFSLRPLLWGSDYTSILGYQLQDRKEETVRKSTFTTTSMGENLIRISGLEQTIVVPKGQRLRFVVDWDLLPSTQRSDFHMRGSYYNEEDKDRTKLQAVNSHVFDVFFYVDKAVVTSDHCNLNITIMSEEEYYLSGQ